MTWLIDLGIEQKVMRHESLGVLTANSDQLLWLLAGLGPRGEYCCLVLAGTVLVIFSAIGVFGDSKVEGEGLRLRWVGSASGWSCMGSGTRVDVTVSSYDSRYVQVPT